MLRYRRRLSIGGVSCCLSCRDTTVSLGSYTAGADFVSASLSFVMLAFLKLHSLTHLEVLFPLNSCQPLFMASALVTIACLPSFSTLLPLTPLLLRVRTPAPLPQARWTLLLGLGFCCVAFLWACTLMPAPGPTTSRSFPTEFLIRRIPSRVL